MPHARAHWGGSAARPAAAVVAGAGAAAVVAATTWLVMAAAERPGTLSPPSLRAHVAHPWVLGPLHGLLPGLSASSRRLHSDVVVVLVVIGVGWFAAWVAAPALGSRALLGATAAAHAVLFLGPPLSLTDAFNYGLYGRMAALHGLNPYRAFPVQAAGDPLYPLANWHHLRSPYGPVFTLGTEALTPLGAHGWFWAWKGIVVLSSLGTVMLAAALAQRLGASRPRAIAALGLSPLLLVSEVGGFHQDVPALACLVGAAWCLVRGREADAPRWVDPAAGALAVVAAGIKPSFGIVIGVIVLGATRRPRAIAGAAVAAAAVGLIVLIAFGGALPDLSTQGRLVTPLSVPNLLGLAAGHHGADQAVRSMAQVALVAVALVATAVVAVRRQWAISAIGVVLFCAVLGLAWVMPWYLVWALPFIAVGRPRVLAPLAVVATCWLTVGSLPQLPGILHSAGYYPTRTSTGLQNHLEFRRLVR
jgi:hypothetical protein